MKTSYWLPLAIAVYIALSTSAPNDAAWHRRAPGCGSDATLGPILERTVIIGLPTDSAGLSGLGLATRPTTGALLTSGATCDSVVAAHNASVTPDSTWMVTTLAPLIVKAGTSFFMRVPNPTGSVGFTIFVYDSTLTYRKMIDD
jgi:hypothetical protein